MKKKLRVALLFGGKSAEHEISLISARNIFEAMDKKKYDVVAIGIDKQGRWFVDDQARLLRGATQPKVEFGSRKNAAAVLPGETKALMVRPSGGAPFGGVDVVVNFTGGDTWLPSLRCVKRGGKVLVCGATAGHDPKEDLRYIWSFELQVIGSNSFYDDNLVALMDLIQQGTLRPVVDTVLPLEKAAEGLRLIQDREVIGKVVVTP